MEACLRQAEIIGAAQVDTEHIFLARVNLELDIAKAILTAYTNPKGARIASVDGANKHVAAPPVAILFPVVGPADAVGVATVARKVVGHSHVAITVSVGGNRYACDDGRSQQKFLHFFLRGFEMSFKGLKTLWQILRVLFFCVNNTAIRVVNIDKHQKVFKITSRQKGVE